MSQGFTEMVYRTVRAVPRGKVVSYGGVAALIGRPRAARGVGRALFDLPDGHDVPWWRVVNRNGEISIKGVFHGPALQRSLLEGEGVRFDRAGRIDWKRFGWTGNEAGGEPGDEAPSKKQPGPRRTTAGKRGTAAPAGRPRR